MLAESCSRRAPRAAVRSSRSPTCVEGNDIVNLLEVPAQDGASANASADKVIAPSQTTVRVEG